MSKSIYSEEEVKQLIQNLFLEKKKGKELEQKMQLLEQEHRVLIAENQENKAALLQKNLEIEEIEKLKNLVAAYKKKSTQTIHALYEIEHQKIKQETAFAHQQEELQLKIKELIEENKVLLEQQVSKPSEPELSLKSELEKERLLNQALQRENQDLKKNFDDSQRHAEQLDRALKHLHERSQEAYLELSQLRDDFQRSQEAVVQNNEQLQASQKRQHETAQELHMAQQENQELVLEIEALQNQFALLKEKVSESQAACNKVLQEKISLEEKFELKNQRLKQIEEDLAALKQSFVKATKEAKEIEGMYLEIVNEKAELGQRSNDLEKLLDARDQEIERMKTQLEEAVKKEMHAQEQRIQSEQALKEKHEENFIESQKRTHELEISLQKHHETLREKEREIEEATHQILLLSQEKLRLENALAEVARYQNEQDAHMRAAQQHLGKKVKEATLLNEKIELQQAQNAELQNSITQLKAKMEEMQASFEQKMQQEKNHQEQLHESIRFAEGQVVKWEDKCLKAYEKLKILEEKHQQFQTLFSSLGNVMGVKSNLSTLTSISAPTSFKETMHFVELPKVKEEVIQEQRTLSSEPSLFEMEQKPRKNIRQNLFD